MYEWVTVSVGAVQWCNGVNPYYPLRGMILYKEEGPKYPAKLRGTGERQLDSKMFFSETQDFLQDQTLYKRARRTTHSLAEGGGFVRVLWLL
jgi:hypothetical protein